MKISPGPGVSPALCVVLFTLKAGGGGAGGFMMKGREYGGTLVRRGAGGEVIRVTRGDCFLSL